MEERFTGPLVGTSTKPVLFPSPPSYFILRSFFPGFGFFEDGEEDKKELSGTDDLHDRGGALGDLTSSRDKVFKDYSMG